MSRLNQKSFTGKGINRRIKLVARSNRRKGNTQYFEITNGNILDRVKSNPWWFY